MNHIPWLLRRRNIPDSFYTKVAQTGGSTFPRLRNGREAIIKRASLCSISVFLWHAQYRVICHLTMFKQLNHTSATFAFSCNGHRPLRQKTKLFGAWLLSFRKQSPCEKITIYRNIQIFHCTETFYNRKHNVSMGLYGWSVSLPYIRLYSALRRAGKSSLQPNANKSFFHGKPMADTR